MRGVFLNAFHEASVVHVALEGIVTLLQSQTDAGFRGVKGEVHHFGVA